MSQVIVRKRKNNYVFRKKTSNSDESPGPNPVKRDKINEEKKLPSNKPQLPKNTDSEKDKYKE